MSLLESFTRLVSRFKHPVSLPEDLSRDLGIQLSNTLDYNDFLKLLASSHCRPNRLKKFMKREVAEGVFCSAIKKESFKSSSLFSYYFSKGWLVIALYFDEEERLRRLNLQCPNCCQFEGFDIPLES